MSSVGTRTIIWDNGEDEFCIAKFGSILALEEKCDAGIGQILKRLEDGTWRLNDLRETIRLGLIGAGMAPEKAMAAVKLHVDGQPLAKSVMIAHAVIEAALVGVPDDPVGKTPAAGAETQAQVSSTTTAASAAQQSSELAEPSGGPQASPTNIRSGKLPQSSMATTGPTPQTGRSPTL